MNTKFDPGGFLSCNSKQFMFVVIAKNASTTLKSLVYSLDYPGAEPILGTEMIHDFFGFSFDNKVRITLKGGDGDHVSGYTKFAVYRDPVERFMSVYYDKVSPLRSSGKPIRRYFSESGIIGSDIDTFLEFTKLELKKVNVLSQDEHLRKQVSFYDPSDVDFIVPLESLDSFLLENIGVSISSYSNRSGRDVSAKLTENQIITLKSLYEDDYDLLKAENIYHPTLPR